MQDLAAEVLVVGAGPTGLMLAGELAARGARVIVVDAADEPDESPKGNGIIGHAAVRLRRLGVLDGTGLKVVRPPRIAFGPIDLRLGLGPGNPLHLLAIPQRRLEHLLEARAVAHGARVLRGHAVVTVDQSDGDITARLATPGGEIRATAAFLVGCDGARSTVRKQADIGFPGFTSDRVAHIARLTIQDVAITVQGGEVDLPGIGRFAAFRPNRTAGGSFSIAPAAALDQAQPSDLYIVAAIEPRDQATQSDTPSVDDLRASLRRVLGADLPFTAATALRVTVGNSRQADAYVRGRVLLAGDAAHIFNAGGSSINAGLLDALDLAPRLAAVVKGTALPATIADYETARRAACDRTLAHTRLQSALEKDDEHGDALRTTIGALLRGRAARRSLARMIEAAPSQ